MVDAKTYKPMHGDQEEVDDPEELDEDSMRADDLPAEPFVPFLPATIPDNGFHNKKWSKCLHQI
jgi:hypothetical protein